jgi:hypothetical protein
LLLISLMYLITYLDRVNISTAAPVISKEFGFGRSFSLLSGRSSARRLHKRGAVARRLWPAGHTGVSLA